MAMCARLSDMGGVNGRILIFRGYNVMFAMAIGAYRRLAYALFHRFAVNARFVLFSDIGVAHAAGVGHTFAEFIGRWPP